MQGRKRKQIRKRKKNQKKIIRQLEVKERSNEEEINELEILKGTKMKLLPQGKGEWKVYSSRPTILTSIEDIPKLSEPEP